MTTAALDSTVRVRYADLVAGTARIFAARGLTAGRARSAAAALCYGDAAGHPSHGLANLTRLYLPALDEGRIDPAAEPRTIADRGAALLLDGRRAPGLWLAGAAMRTAVRRAARYGIGLVSVRAATHIGCAGYHAVRAVAHGMVGIVACNCGRQRIAPPPDGRVPLLGTNPVSVAAPAGRHHPYLLDMSTTAAPTGRIRAAARAGQPVPEDWLADAAGRPVVDPAAFDAGAAHLLWLGGSGSGGYKGFGLGLAVEVLAALLSGAGFGPAPEALSGGAGSAGRDDDIGLAVLAIAPGTLRGGAAVAADADALFGTVLACPPARDGVPVRYPGWYEAERVRRSWLTGVPLDPATYRELCGAAGRAGVEPPAVLGDA
jgi:LDH2 family malate/lactate/ureidoglycolate dehydrogenase